MSTRTARVVIIGGGMMGTGLAWHLAEEGWRDITLLEKATLTSGSTWHAAGQCPHFVGSYNLSKIHAYGIECYSTLQERSGQYVSWHGCGGLRLAMTKDEVEWFHKVRGFGPNAGFEMEIIPPEEAVRYHPFLTTEGVLAVARTFTDGHLDPASACQAMASMATRLGVSIVQNTRATDITRAKDGSWRVHTTEGDWLCEHVVNAGGCYAHEIQTWVGGRVPIANMQHHYVVTDTLPALLERDEELPVVRDPYASAYLRQEQKSGLIGIYETEGGTLAWGGGAQDWQAEHELFEPDYDRIALWLERAFERIPLFGEVGIKRTVHGAIPHTPDANPMLGPAPGLTNFWMCCGSSIGIGQGAGCGKYLAQWMVHGASEINMVEFDPKRFGNWTDMAYTHAKGIEDYECMYTLLVPGEEREAGRGVRTSPLYATLQAAGGHHTEGYGWERPKWFATGGEEEIPNFRRSNLFDLIGEECAAVRERVGLIDLTAFAKFDVRGQDAEALIAQAYANTPPGMGRITLAHRLSRNGRIVGESTIARLDAQHFYAVSGAAWEEKDFDALTEIVHENNLEATITSVTEDFGAIGVIGPQSRALLASLSEDDWSAFPWLTAREVTVAGVRLRALRVNYAGSLGWELHAPMAQLLALYAALWEAGQDFGIANFGSYALNSLRLEKAYKGLGADITNEITPREAGIMRFVRKQGGFMGAEAIPEKPVDTVIVYGAIDTEAAARDAVDVAGGEAVLKDGECIGVTTSGGYGYTVQKSLFFAYVQPQYAAPGTTFEIDILGKSYTATVLEDCAFDPENRVLRG